MSSVRSIPVQNQVPVTQLYRKLEIVGKGAYGAVYRGIHIPTGDVVALKIINLDTPDDDVADIQREVALLSQLRGPGTNNVTKYYGCYLDGPRVWIVMDFASGGSVRTLMKATNGNVIEERYSVVIVRELLVALAYLHKSGVIHRDVKAANVLVTEQGRVLLCDFGVSALLSTTQSKRTTFVGTPYWMAPEVITSGSMYDSKADIWSLGITLYETATGSPPHANQVEMRVLQLIPSTKPPRLAEHEGSKDMRDFLAACLKEVPGERATAEELSKMKWIKNAAKTPVSILRELIVQYDAWCRAGGVRKSILNDDTADDDESLKAGNRESTWEFDTVRAGSLPFDPSAATVLNTENALDELSPPRVAPRSLRMLFEDETSSAGVDPFRFQPHSRMTTPIPPSSGRQSPIDRPRDTDKTIKQQLATAPSSAPTPPLPPITTDLTSLAGPSGSPGALSPQQQARTSDPATARQATFAFPQFPPTSSSPRMNHRRTPMSSSEDDFAENRQRSSRTPTYREVRHNRGLPDIAIPPNPRLQQEQSDDTSRSPSPTRSIPPRFESVRTDSIASGSSASTIRRVRKIAAASPANFQFPTTRPRGGSQPAPPSSPPTGVVVTSKLSSSPPAEYEYFPTAMASSPSSHHTAHSLDAALGSGLSVPPPFSRAQSATPAGTKPTRGAASPAVALSRGPSLNRQGSVAVMESVPTPTPSVAPLRLHSATSTRARDRSGSVPGGYKSEGEAAGLRVPPLKEFLKLSPLPLNLASGAADLLPPSPSIATSLSRISPKGSLHINTSVESSAPPPFDSQDSLFNLKPPESRPLDFSSFVGSSAETHDELARTVDELSRWLSVVENGLAVLLEKAGSINEAIEEEVGMDSETSFDGQM